MTELKIYNTPEMVAREFAAFFYTLALQYQQKGKELHVALSGGSTPKIWFGILKQEYKDKIKWNMIHFYWGDERMVPETDQESNYGEASRMLFSAIPVPSANIHPISGSNKIDDEVKRYTDVLFRNLDVIDGIPVFDLIILGMGDDGHTASIFPDQMELIHSGGICAPAYHPESGQPRITLTGKVINQSRNVAFLITGKNKAFKLSSIFNQDKFSVLYPAAHIKPVSDQLFFFVDSDAADNLLFIS